MTRPRSWSRLAACAFAAAALGCSDGAGGEAGAGSAGQLGAGSRELAPDFTLALLSGEGELGLADLRGKTVVIDFWATWCPPCEFQVPELNAFFDAHREDSDVAVIGISIDTDGPEVISEWTTEKGVRYPILLGDEDLSRRYGAIGFPTLVIVNPAGEIEERHVGLIERASLEEVLARLRRG